MILSHSATKKIYDAYGGIYQEAEDLIDLTKEDVTHLVRKIRLYNTWVEQAVQQYVATHLGGKIYLEFSKEYFSKSQALILKKSWKKFCMKTTFDESSLEVFLTNLLGYYITDGEIFIYADKGKIREISPLRVDMLYDRESDRIHNSIEYDIDGKPIAYHIRKKKSGIRQRISSNKVIHAYRKYYPESNRGMSFLLSVIAKVYSADKLLEASINRQQVRAGSMLTYSSNSEEDLKKYNRAERVKWEPFGVNVLNSSREKLEFLSSNDSSASDIETVIDTLLRGIAGAIPTGSFYALSQKFGEITFSALIGHFLMLTREQFIQQQWIISQILRPIVAKAWFYRLLEEKLVTVDQFDDIMLSLEFQLPALGDVKPLDRAKFIDILIANGTMDKEEAKKRLGIAENF